MNEIWNENKYQKFLEYLNSLADLKYKKFHSGLGINKEYLIGIPVPVCKDIAIKISESDYSSFINLNTHNTYEERLIHGLILGYIKEDFNNIQVLLNGYIPYIDNWALCDTVIANLHIWKNNTKEGLKFVKNCLNSKNEWHNRVGYVLLLDYYIKEEYLDMIFKYCNNYKANKYYVNMAIAWLISICFIKYPIKTSNYLKNNELNAWTHNKAIQKIRESKRIDKETKEKIIEWKK